MLCIEEYIAREITHLKIKPVLQRESMFPSCSTDYNQKVYVPCDHYVHDHPLIVAMNHLTKTMMLIPKSKIINPASKSPTRISKLITVFRFKIRT